MKKLELNKENSIKLTEESKKINEELKKVAYWDEFPYARVIRLEKDDDKLYNTLKKVKEMYNTYSEYKERLDKRFEEVSDDSNMDFFDDDTCLIAKKGYEKEFEELKETKEALHFYVNNLDEILNSFLKINI